MMVGVREGWVPRLELDKGQRKLMSRVEKEAYNPFISDCNLRLLAVVLMSPEPETVFVQGQSCRGSHVPPAVPLPP